MTTFGSALRENPLRTKKDLQEAVMELYAPLIRHFTPGCARLSLGTSNAHYGEAIAGMEAFSRLLWGWVPLTAGDSSGKAADDPRVEELWPKLLHGVRNGTNPEHAEYWGAIHDIDQRMVEMAALGLGLMMAPERLWEPLHEKEKQHLYRWLNQINEHRLVDSNWQFFRVFVNLGFQNVGLPVDRAAQEESLEKLESYYLGEGWYSDGHTEQRDYYIPFAFHFYSLIYAVVMKEKDPDRARVFKQRAESFARDFIYWFAADGSAIPFGRSMTYRFAQAAFWSALAFADLEAFDWGVIKGLVLRHLRWWMRQPIFSPEGLLTIGYGYSNLNMAEGYNAPGSPYWAMKSFLVLALDDEHPFWKAVEKPLPTLQAVQKQVHPRMMISRDKAQKHVYALTSGQILETEHAHNAAKYAKFAYSNIFGFSVPKGAFGLSLGAHDSMLALSEKDGYYRARRGCEQVEWQGRALYSRWRPWRDVQVETWLVAIDAWHVRLHRIETHRALDTAEGGFAIAVEKEGYRSAAGEATLLEEEGVAFSYPWGISGIVNLLGERKPETIKTDPNTNVIHSCSSYIPTLIGPLEKGTHWFGTAVYAAVHAQGDGPSWRETPQLTAEGEGVWTIRYREREIVQVRK